MDSTRKTRLGPALIAGVISVLAIAGILWLWQPFHDPGPSSSRQHVGHVMRSTGERGATVSKTHGTETEAMSVPLRRASIELRPTEPERSADVASVLDELSKLYGPAGKLSWDEARVLVATRKSTTEALVARLAALGRGGAAAIASRYEEATTRGRLLLVRGLEQVQDPETPEVLGALLEREETFSLRRALVVALGKRREPAAEAVLGRVRRSAEDSRLRTASVHALSGRADALTVLAETVRNDPDRRVRKEAVRALGLTGDRRALATLNELARGEAVEPSVRASAIQELARSFQDASLEALGSLLADEDEHVRAGVVSALRRLHSEEATALLEGAAANDDSAVVRRRARAALDAAPIAASRSPPPDRLADS